MIGLAGHRMEEPQPCVVTMGQEIFPQLDDPGVGIPVVDQDHILGAKRILLTPQHRMEIVQRRKGIDGNLPILEQLPNSMPLGCVFTDQDDTPGKRGIGITTDAANGFEFCSKPETGTFTRFTDHTDIAVHKRCQFFADRQPQAGTSETSGGGTVGLGKGFEQALGGAGLDADSRIHDLESVSDPIVPHLQFPGGDQDLSRFSEFRSIATQVGQNLPQARGISPHIHVTFTVHPANQLQPLLLSTVRKLFTDRFHELSEIELDLLELHLRRLDL